MKHFDFMGEIETQFHKISAEILDCRYTPYCFGSWYVVIRRSGIVFRIAWDGRDETLVFESGGKGTSPSQTWEFIESISFQQPFNTSILIAKLIEISD